jgi:RNA polymerase sigma factor (TIGR02999 family)
VSTLTTAQITRLLRRMDGGEPGALDELMRVVYADLERMAASQLRRQFGDRAGQVTLDPAGLVSETFLQLIKQRKGFDNRGQFFAIATRLMLRALGEYRRRRGAARRGGGGEGGDLRLTLALEHVHGDDGPGARHVVEVGDLAASLERLEALDPRRAEIVKMRTVWSMTVDDVAEALEISPSSVDRDWKWAKAWLADDLGLLDD